MNISSNHIIGELVAQDYRTAGIFKKYEIDFCCNGNKSIEEACGKKHIEPLQILDELNAVVQKRENQSIDYQAWPIDLLADYIEKKHHRYVVAKIKEIKPYLEKIRQVHGANHPELLEIEQLFSDSVQALTMHMQKEELVLFPYIRKMTESDEKEIFRLQSHFGTVGNPIMMMEDEHSAEGDRFRRIATLTNNYTAPPDACNTYRVAFALLQEFEEDLHLHIHLENNILFPKAISLENELNNASSN